VQQFYKGSVATRVNDGRIFNDFFIANLLLSVMVKEFWRSVRILQSYGKKMKWHLFSRTWRICHDCTNVLLSHIVVSILTGNGHLMPLW